MILKGITYTFILFFILGCNSMNDCHQKNSLKFGEPINQWVNVKCKDGVEYLAPEDGYTWIDANNNEVLLFADLRQVNDEEIDGEDPGRYFEKQFPEKLTGRHEVINFNNDLTKAFGGKFEFKDIFYSRVFTEDNRMSYELHFYVNEGASSPSYLTITIGNGWVLEPPSYRVVKK